MNFIKNAKDMAAYKRTSDSLCQQLKISQQLEFVKPLVERIVVQ